MFGRLTVAPIFWRYETMDITAVTMTVSIAIMRNSRIGET
jgi:hypothetical protein